MAHEEILIGYDVEVSLEHCVMYKKYAHSKQEDIIDTVLRENNIESLKNVLVKPKTMILTKTF